MKYSQVAAALCLFATSMAQPWHSMVAYPDLSTFFGQRIWDSSVWTPNTVTQWPAGTLPASCASQMQARGCSASHVQVYNVTYSDCARPWVFCRCDYAPVSIGRTADIFGRMPVHMRSMVRHPMIVPNPDGQCCCAAPDDGDLMVAGDCPIETFAHEVSHLIDNRGDVFGEDFSSKSTFVNALAADTCSISNYGNTNGRHEEFAEMGVVALYNVNTNLLPAVDSSATTGCFSNQLSAIKTKFGSQFYAYGGTCVNRQPDSLTQPATKRVRVKRENLVGRAGWCRYKQD
ncbi:hypothetical protein H072_1131 [Dactylellina haptotyla CBS 200.50]|uniref:Lysine-specific metallo-endopeptidase domain-containing protein n=1 Tax=Dactylellina haptotyla (strain CBS 200.50) TaxID=1284197 RepID=S8AVB0_DACHA|nr:hypothetical protein H072_1131 [Dactylellina haptotyla CBS 200.50]